MFETCEPRKRCAAKRALELNGLSRLPRSPFARSTDSAGSVSIAGHESCTLFCSLRHSFLTHGQWLNQSQAPGPLSFLKHSRSQAMHRLGLAVLVLSLVGVDPTRALAMGAGGGGGAGAAGGSPGASASGGGAGAGNGTPINAKRDAIPPAGSAKVYGATTSDAVKDPPRVQQRPRSSLLERPGRQ